MVFLYICLDTTKMKMVTKLNGNSFSLLIHNFTFTTNLFIHTELGITAITLSILCNVVKVNNKTINRNLVKPS